MAEFIAGPTTVWKFAYTGGTIDLSPDLRSVQWSPSGDLVDSSAGADTYKGRLAALKDASMSITAVSQAAGTAVTAAFDANVQGTVTFQPEGTATNKRKITFPCFSGGAQYSFPYADVVTFTCSFTGNGAYTEGVN